MPELNEKPMPPGDYECCESGCSPCVWDHYYDELKQWNEQQKQLKQAQEKSAQAEVDAAQT